MCEEQGTSSFVISFDALLILFQSFPASIYSPWVKPGSSAVSKIDDFGREVGQTALDCVKKLNSRHACWHPKMSIKEPAAVVWEDSWSSKSLGTKANQYLGTRDRDGEVIVHILGEELRKKGIKFTDPTFPPSVESLFVYPSTSRIHSDMKAGKRIDTSIFLAGLDPASNIKWSRPSEVYNGETVQVSKMTLQPCNCRLNFRLIQIWASDGDKIKPDDVVQGRLGNCCAFCPIFVISYFDLNITGHPIQIFYPQSAPVHRVRMIFSFKI